MSTFSQPLQGAAPPFVKVNPGGTDPTQDIGTIARVESGSLQRDLQARLQREGLRAQGEEGRKGRAFAASENEKNRQHDEDMKRIERATSLKMLRLNTQLGELDAQFNAASLKNDRDKMAEIRKEKDKRHRELQKYQRQMVSVGLMNKLLVGALGEKGTGWADFIRNFTGQVNMKIGQVSAMGRGVFDGYLRDLGVDRSVSEGEGGKGTDVDQEYEDAVKDYQRAMMAGARDPEGGPMMLPFDRAVKMQVAANKRLKAAAEARKGRDKRLETGGKGFEHVSEAIVAAANRLEDADEDQIQGAEELLNEMFKNLRTASSGEAMDEGAKRDLDDSIVKAYRKLTDEKSGMLDQQMVDLAIYTLSEFSRGESGFSLKSEIKGAAADAYGRLLEQGQETDDLEKSELPEAKKLRGELRKSEEVEDMVNHLRRLRVMKYDAPSEFFDTVKDKKMPGADTLVSEVFRTLLRVATGDNRMQFEDVIGAILGRFDDPEEEMILAGIKPVGEQFSLLDIFRNLDPDVRDALLETLQGTLSNVRQGEQTLEVER